MEKYLTHPKALSNDELDDIMNILNVKGYLGSSWTRDYLPNKPLKVGESIIVNMDEMKNEGTHWVACYRDKKYYIYVDSFGVIPPPSIIKYLLGRSRKNPIIYNTDDIQPHASQLCGYYSAYFIVKVSRGVPFLDALDIFKVNNNKINDKILIKELMKL